MRMKLTDVYRAVTDEVYGLHISIAAGLVEAGIEFGGVSTDTRSIKPGDLFVALISPNADGHDFVEQAIARGASAIVISDPDLFDRMPYRRPAFAPIVKVQDTTVAYGRIARAWRDRIAIPVIGVTGSVGKTTVKEMLALALSPLGPVVKTELSQNNETGVPKTLLRLDDTHRAAVVEMGMRGKGQIADLCRIAAPTIGVITIIADNHAELLGSRDAIADAKAELVASLPPDGVAILNADDPYFDRLRAQTKAGVVTFGLTDRADYRPTDIVCDDRGWSFTLHVAGTAMALPVTVPSPSRHDIPNALAALAAAHAAGCRLEESIQAIASYAGPPMRMQVAKAGWATVLNDAYNAAPASVRSALETLVSYPGGRKIAFLGDMRELGDIAERSHRELGDHIAALGGLDALYTVGDLAALIPGAADRFATSDDAARFAAAMDVQPGDVVLVKGSRAMAMEKIANSLLARKDISC